MCLTLLYIRTIFTHDVNTVFHFIMGLQHAAMKLGRYEPNPLLIRNKHVRMHNIFQTLI